MKSQSDTASRLTNGLALVITGLAIGWMMGMSVSPVVQTVIASVLTLLVSVLSLLAGMPAKSDSPVKERKPTTGVPIVETHVLGNVVTVLATNNPSVAQLSNEPADPEADGRSKPPTPRASIALWPVAVFVLFLVVGSAGGIFTRTNDLLGPRPSVLAWRWGLNAGDTLRSQLRESLINRRFPLTNGVAIAQATSPSSDEKSVLNVGAGTATDNQITHEDQERAVRPTLLVLNQLPTIVPANRRLQNLTEAIRISKLSVIRSIWLPNRWGDYAGFEAWVTRGAMPPVPPSFIEPYELYQLQEE